MATVFDGFHLVIPSGAAEYRKEIRFDRVTRDYAYYLNNEIKGYAATNREAEVKLNELVFNLLGGKEAH